jgi:GNAT superfamily N-acetyltransferase
MIYRLAIWIKAKLPFIWSILEFANGLAFKVFFANKFKKSIDSELDLSKNGNNYIFRRLFLNDLEALSKLCLNIEEDQKQYFEPHNFDKGTLVRLNKNPSFLMFGLFHKDELAGYFFLRCFVNKKCFLGRYLHPDYRNKGLGKLMNKVLYHSAWRAGFRVFATFSQDNKLVVNAHQKNSYVKHIADLKDNYILVEFVNPGDQK